MSDRAVKFVVLATQRSGTTWVTSVLNGFPGVTAHGELLLPQPRSELRGWNPDSTYPRFIEVGTEGRSIRPFSLFSYLNSLYGGTETVGFKLMYSHVRMYPEVALYLISHRISAIHLIRRNVLDIVLSQAVRAELGAAHLRVGEKAPEALKVRLDPDQLIPRLERIGKNQVLFRRLLSLAKLRHIEVAYEDLLSDEDEFRQIWEFLGGGADWHMPQVNLARIRTGTHRDTLNNYEEVKAALSGTAYAGMLD